MGGGGRKRKKSTQLSKGDAKAYNTERRHLPIRKPRRKLFNHCHTVQVESCVRACTYIRTKVRWRPHYRLPEVVLPNYSCKSKVAQLGLWERTAGGKQHILGLQITMDHILGVEVAEGCQNLREKRRGEEARLQDSEAGLSTSRCEPGRLKLVHKYVRTWYTKNFVSRSVSLLSGLLKMSSNMSPCIFSMTT